MWFSRTPVGGLRKKSIQTFENVLPNPKDKLEIFKKMGVCEMICHTMKSIRAKVGKLLEYATANTCSL